MIHACTRSLKAYLLLTIFGGVFIFMWLNTLMNSPSEDKFLLQSRSNGTRFRILWYNPCFFINVTNKDALHCGFKKCKYSNCDMTLNRMDANISHAVIFDGRSMPKNLTFTRPNGQIWIFQAHESPISYEDTGKWWYNNTDYSFNWTMTYDKTNSDIYLPYGEILKQKMEVKRDFKSIARQKNNSLLIIVSHCDTRAKRQEYVNELKKFADVEILGSCGKAWKCGVHFKHDEHCFKLLNSSYKFYLAFENAFCRQYITEKFYENFNYDLIMIVRGGLPGDYKQMLPNGTFLSTDDFKSVKDLAKFLKDLSVETYADLLKQKSQYYSAGYLHVYQRAMCNLCERMNFQSKYSKTIPDMKDWAFGSKPCINPKKVSDIR